MIKHFKLYYILPIFIGIGIAALFCIQNRPVRNADKVLTTLLNLPAEPITEIYETMDTSIDHMVHHSQEPNVFSPDDTLIKKAYQEIFGDIVSDSFIEDCIRLDNITALHYLAIEQGSAARLKKLDIGRTKQKEILTYEAELLVHTTENNEKQIQITGQIQFDSTGKICAVHINGRELLRLLEMQ